MDELQPYIEKALLTVVSIAFLIILFRPLELAFPAKPGQRFFRPAWFLDLCFFLGQYLLWSGVVSGVLPYFEDWLDGDRARRIPPRGGGAAVVAAGDRE